MNISKKIYINSIYHLIKKNNLISYLLVISFFFLDRISKAKIIDHQLYNDQIYINDYINFDLVWNTGIGFGFFSSNSSLIYNLISFTIGLIIIYVFYLLIKSMLFEKILFSLVLAGALGNFYDRLVYSAVPDFIDLHYKSFHWFTFNMADIFITLGIIMLLIKELLSKNETN
jgi:signal peptidase II